MSSWPGLLFPYPGLVVLTLLVALLFSPIVLLLAFAMRFPRAGLVIPPVPGIPGWMAVVLLLA